MSGERGRGRKSSTEFRTQCRFHLTIHEIRPDLKPRVGRSTDRATWVLLVFYVKVREIILNF